MPLPSYQPEGAADEEIGNNSMAMPPQNRKNQNIGRDIFNNMANSGVGFYPTTRSANDEIDGLSAQKQQQNRAMSQMGGLTASKRMASPGSRYQRPQQQ